MLCRRINLGVFIIALLHVANSAGATTYSFTGYAAGRYAHHLQPSVPGPASERVDFDLQQKIVTNSRWTFVIGGHAFYENIYRSPGNHYPSSIRLLDSAELRLQDTYAQYKFEGTMIRLGNQQVVWGETFANMHSDVINPRDLREGAQLSAEATRRSIPMAFVKYIKNGWSAEFLGVPRPEFHLLPLPGSDYAPLSAEELKFVNLNIQRETYRWGFEYGGRVTKTVDALAADFSVFAINHYDRFPYYEVPVVSPLASEVDLRERHKRINTFGMGVAKDWEGYVARAEFVDNVARYLPIRSATGVGFTQTDEQIIVMALDFPTWRRFNLSIQYSSSHLTEFRSYLLRFTDQNIGALRASLGLFEESTIEVVAAKSFLDDGARIQTEFMTPVSHLLELHFGVEIYGGPVRSELGRLHEADRIYLSAKAFLPAFKPTGKWR